MKARRLFALIGAAALVSSMFAGSATVANAAKAPKALSVGTDAVGDWGLNAPAAPPSQVGDALGQDLTGASISSDGKNINFIFEVNFLPPNGGAPEVTRYTWDFLVDGEFREIDGKWLNYTRGTCDPTAGTCPPPRDPGQQPFVVRGNCHVEALVATNLTVCEEFALVKGVFDPAAKTITVTVPMKAIGAKKGSKIEPGTNIFGGSVSAAPSVWVTSSAFPLDTLTVTKTFVVK